MSEEYAEHDMMSLRCARLCGIAWSVIATRSRFPRSSWLGGWTRLSTASDSSEGSIPHFLFALSGDLLRITAALISGADVERMRFGPYLAFITLWSILIYAPIAHWVWGGGWLSTLGALDFAGGTVVHINAAAAALVVAVVLGARKDYARQAIIPQNVPFTLLGAGLLWFGWFGFNGGSALAANASSGPGRSSSSSTGASF